MKRIRISAVVALMLGVGVEIAKADFVFGTPTNLGPTINSPALDSQPSMSADGLSLFFYSERPGGYGDRDVWVAGRATTNEGWTTVENVGPPVNTSHRDSGPAISADGLTLFFDSDRPGGSGESDIWVTTRTTKSDPWATPVNLGPTVNASSYDAYPSVSADGLTLFMQSNRPGGYGRYDIWMTTRQATGDPWTTPVNLGSTVNSSAIEGDPSISPDGLVLLFTSLRSGGYGISDMYLVRRATIQDSWGSPTNLGPVVNSPSIEAGPSISADGLTFYFESERPGGEGSGDLWEVAVEPVVDLNGDETVDAADMCIMVDHWDTDGPLCDIAPMPWGDGVVDVQDLVVLAEHLFEEVLPPELAAYWKLDETEGNVARESVSGSDDVIMGSPLWQPTGGKVDGALELDGVGCYVTSGSGLNPEDGPFSIFAWVKGGAAGQAIISQVTGANWLMADAQGKLMTQIRNLSRYSGPLLSQTIITDGQWHHIGLVWDGSYRSLYVDGIEVAKDTVECRLESSDGGLHIGAGKTLEPSSFFSGLIDDVRIYSVALSAQRIEALAH
ncbi:MAG: PD40 domain-containing protein [Phycisphaerales bacterium]|nr:MAG: PD40 domain-containing protein [Phycisphaerales bacterium]